VAPDRSFDPDQSQRRLLEHRGGPLLVTGGAGTGKTTVLRERFAGLIEGGADPERVALVVGTKRARAEARGALLGRLRKSLPGLKVLTVHALAYHVMANRFSALDYDEPPAILSAADQFAKVRELLFGEDPARWPAYGSLLAMRGFADQVRQFLLRAQEAQLEPEEIAARAKDASLSGWPELAEFYRRYLDVLGGEPVSVDFAGLVWQAAVAAEKGPPLFDHLLVDDYQDTTVGAESLIVALQVEDLVVAGDLQAHVFSFQGTTDRPLRRFTERFPTASHLELNTNHRTEGASLEAWCASHTSEEHAAVARELRRTHLEEGIPWERMAVVVRRQGDHLGGLLRALDDARVPRTVPQAGAALATEPAAHPFVLALRWLARPEQRDALVETVLTSELVGLSPATARGVIRAAQAEGGTPADALAHPEGLSLQERDVVETVRRLLEEAEKVATGSVLDAFRLLWQGLPYSHRLVAASQDPLADRRSLDTVMAFADTVARAGRSADPSVEAFVAALEPGDGAPGLAADGDEPRGAVHVLTAHATAGREFDTVVVTGAVEGDFPSLARPEPLFDLDALEGTLTRSERNRLRLEDERRLFRMVASRAVRRVLFTANDAHGEATLLTARSRFVDELRVPWRWIPAPPGEPVSVREATSTWRRTLADDGATPSERLSALDGLVALGADPGRWWFQQDWTGSERPLHETIRVSASRLETLENCDLQFVLREELGLARPAGYHAWVGKLVHRIIEDCENGLIPRSAEALVAEAEQRWRPEQFPSLAVSEAFRRLVTELMLPNWFANYADKSSLATEVGFSFELEGATVAGYIDRIGPILAGGNKVVDFKTGKADKAGKAEESLQLGVYYLAAHEAEDLAPFRPVRGVELAFLRGHWRTGELERRQWQVGESSKRDEEYQAKMRDRLSGLIARVRELYETERYRPSTSADCYFCDFKTLCPLWPEGRPLFPVEAS